jgi:hypothetical protein
MSAASYKLLARDGIQGQCVRGESGLMLISHDGCSGDARKVGEVNKSEIFLVLFSTRDALVQDTTKDNVTREFNYMQERLF